MTDESIVIDDMDVAITIYRFTDGRIEIRNTRDDSIVIKWEANEHVNEVSDECAGFVKCLRWAFGDDIEVTDITLTEEEEAYTYDKKD